MATPVRSARSSLDHLLSGLRRLAGVLGRGGRQRDFDFVDYVACNPDLADKFRNAAQAFEHRTRHAVAEGRLLGSDTLDVRFVRKLARQNARQFNGYRTRGHALRFNGLINDDFLALFDHAFYRDSLAARGYPADLPTRDHCIVHFAEIGVNLGVPFSARHRLDETFYAELLGDGTLPDNPIGEPRWLLSPQVETFFDRAPVAARTDKVRQAAALLRNWLNVGLPGGAAANPVTWLENTFGVVVADLPMLGLPDAPPPATPGGVRERILSLAEHGLPDQQDGVAPPPALCRLSLARAQQLDAQGDTEAAGRILARLLDLAPERPGLFLALGDHHRGSDPDRARRFYTLAIEHKQGGAGTYLALAALQRADGDLAGAVETLRLASTAYPTHARVERVKLAAETRLFRQGLNEACRRARAGSADDARQGLAHTLDQLAAGDRPGAVTRSSSERIAILVGDQASSRVTALVAQLQACGFAVSLHAGQAAFSRLADNPTEFGYAIVSGRLVTPVVSHAIRRLSAFGALTVYDLDGESGATSDQTPRDPASQDSPRLPERRLRDLDTVLLRYAVQQCDYAFSTGRGLIESSDGLAAGPIGRAGPQAPPHDLGRCLRALEPAVRTPKIVIVNVLYPPQALGGATRVVHDNVRDLRQLCHGALTFEVFTTREDGDGPYGTSAYVLDGVQVTAVTTANDSALDRRYLDPEMERVFRDYVAASQPDLIHFHCIQRLTASIVDVARDLGIPYLVTMHDGWWISDRQFLLDEDDEIELYRYDDPAQVAERLGADALARQTALAPALHGAQALIAVSGPFADLYRQAGLAGAIAIENGVSDLPAIARTPNVTGRVRLGHVGGRARHKGPHVLREALERGRYRNLTLLAVDHALDGDEVEDMWGDTPVRLVPPVAADQVAELYGRIDVLLAPSIWPESYGLVTREAAALGCWIVASNGGDIAGPVIEAQNGFVVGMGDVADLQRVLAEIDTHPGRYSVPPEVVPRLRRSSEQAADLKKLYQAVIGSRCAAPTAGAGWPDRSPPPAQRAEK